MLTESQIYKHSPILLRTEADFELFFKTSYESFYCYGMHYVDDEDVARDIVSSCFEYVLQRYSQPNEVQDWRSYVARMVRSRCLDYLRHKQVTEAYAELYLNGATEVDDSAEEMELLQERIRVLREGMTQLTPQTRLILTECYLNGKKYREVAEELEISESAVKKHIIKALKQLRAFAGMNQKNENGMKETENEQFASKNVKNLLILALWGDLLLKWSVYN